MGDTYYESYYANGQAPNEGGDSQYGYSQYADYPEQTRAADTYYEGPETYYEGPYDETATYYDQTQTYVEAAPETYYGQEQQYGAPDQYSVAQPYTQPSYYSEQTRLPPPAPIHEPTPIREQAHISQMAKVEQARTSSPKVSPNLDRASKESDKLNRKGTLRKYNDPNGNKKRPTYPLRALVYKTISYQKRQILVNVCCIAGCPFAMVGISFLMAFMITSIIANLYAPYTVLYCSNANSIVSDQVPFPIDNPPDMPLGNIFLGINNVRQVDPTTLGGIANVVSSQGIKGVTASSVLGANLRHANYFVTGTGSPITATGQQNIEFGSTKDCVRWFDNTYPFIAPYARNPNAANPVVTNDATYIPDPLQGWFGNLSDADYVRRLLIDQVYSWAYVSSTNMQGNVQLGYKALIPPIPIDNLTPPNSTNSGGLLGQIPTLFYLSNDTIAGQPLNINVRFVPFFNAVAGDVFQIDDLIATSTQSVIQALSPIDKTVLFSISPTTSDAIKFILSATQILRNLPFGALIFTQMDTTARMFHYTMQYGSDRRIRRMAVFPTEGFRRLVQQSQLATVMLRAINPQASNMKIVSGLRAMPIVQSTMIRLPFGSAIGGLLYPFGVSFMLPIFVLTLVSEKENRILVMMRMNGLNAMPYYVAHFVHFYTLHVVTSAVFILSGRAFGLEFFVLTDPAVYIVLFLVWGFAQIALAFFLSAIFTKTRTALVMSFLLVLIGVIINVATTILFGTQAPSFYLFWPPFAFYRALTVINVASFTAGAPKYRLSDIQPGNEVFNAIVAMLGESVILVIIAVYLSNVLESNNGNRAWHYPISGPLSFCFGGGDKRRNVVKMTDNSKEDRHEDRYVLAEKKRVEERRYPSSCPLVVEEMVKTYGSGKRALKGVSLAIEEGIVFGLLGPNGAGKTTLISILTGLYKPTTGRAVLAGVDLTEDMNVVYQKMGVCPQHDILWPDLTVEEHLLFYARLKGISANNEKQVVQQSMERVGLQSHKQRPSKRLSGGEKRRLSIAIALLGDPKVVFLDEPTTGLDPEVRRFIWNIIQEAKKNRTVILTTHSMEEAEVLCQKIGIMANGTLRCIGPQVLLKSVYGSGFTLNMSCRRQDVLRAAAYVESLLPPNWRRLDSFASNVLYEFSPEPGTISRLFAEMERNKALQGIQEWGLSQTSLDEVFLNIVRDGDADAS